jgi:hypothetical protein
MYYIRSQAQSFLSQISEYRRQIKENHDWNRRKATQEVLKDLTSGSFPDVIDKLKKEYQVDFSNKDQTYKVIAEKLEDDKLKEFDMLVQRAANILEAFCINMKNRIIDPEICYDYMSLIITEINRWAKPYIDYSRKLYDDKLMFIELQFTAEEWGKRIKTEKDTMEETLERERRKSIDSIRPKPRPEL